MYRRTPTAYRAKSSVGYCSTVPITAVRRKRFPLASFSRQRNSHADGCPSPKPDLGDSVDFLTSGFTLLGMRNLLSVYACLRAMLKERRDLALENLALRQQLAVLKRSQRRIKIKRRDRLFWVWLSLTWSGWRAALIIVKPATVVGWHRRGFKLYWTRLSQRGVSGRPAVSQEIRDVIRDMARSNPLWGAPRIHGELLKLGINISERSVSRLMPRRRRFNSARAYRSIQ